MQRTGDARAPDRETEAWAAVAIAVNRSSLTLTLKIAAVAGMDVIALTTTKTELTSVQCREARTKVNVAWTWVERSASSLTAVVAPVSLRLFLALHAMMAGIFPEMSEEALKLAQLGNFLRAAGS